MNIRHKYIYRYYLHTYIPKTCMHGSTKFSIQLSSEGSLPSPIVLTAAAFINTTTTTAISITSVIIITIIIVLFLCWYSKLQK